MAEITSAKSNGSLPVRVLHLAKHVLVLEIFVVVSALLIRKSQS